MKLLFNSRDTHDVFGNMHSFSVLKDPEKKAEYKDIHRTNVLLKVRLMTKCGYTCRSTTI